MQCLIGKMIETHIYVSQIQTHYLKKPIFF